MEAHSREIDGSDPRADVVPERVHTNAGYISNLHVDGYVSVIECRPDTRRSSHYHKTDWHYLYNLGPGLMHFAWRPVGDNGPVARRIVWPGQMVFTPPMVEHWAEFKEATTLVSVSRLDRKHETHEADLVRVGWFE